MADGFEQYHVPQQSRRDKLRVTTADNLQGCAALVPLYDPSLISSDLINYAAAANLRPQSFNLGGNTNPGVKEEGMNLLNFGGGMNSSNHMYVDPQLSVHLNPSPIQEISGSSCVYPAAVSASGHCYRGVGDQSSQGNEVGVYKPDALSIAHQEAANSNSTTGQSLSLSLSSHHSSLPLELNLQRYNDSSMFNNHKVSSVPLGPFTGYASVLKGSRFLKPAQQLLEELCGMGRGFYGEKTGGDSSLLDPSPLGTLSENGIVDDSMNCSDGSDQTRKKSRLLSMLDEVYKRYKQYYQQMQAAVAAFESVAGLSSAAPFANLALKAMNKHFTSLKNAITDQLRSITKSHGKTNSQRDEALQLENSGRGTFSQRPFHHTPGFNDQPVWRPQRGLPERAVAVLRAWLFEHFLHPYPTDTDKLMLAKQTGLSRNQVSNWFINARVRLWKPMVEEIHTLEMRESQKSSQRTEHPPNRLNDHLPTSCSMESENASTSIHRIGEFPLKRTHENPTDHEAPRASEAQMKLPYDNTLHNQQLGSVGFSNATGSGNVSLTLGLHQNGMGLPDSYPINAARRFGLDSQGGEGFMMSGFAAENHQQFGRSDHIGGHLMHDFVG